jgi:alkylhydroperoxidase family enzyme
LPCPSILEFRFTGVVMPAVPYVPHDIAEPRELVAAIRARRGGRLLNLDRVLLHSPPLAEGWNAYLRAVRTSLAVPAKLRELAICAVALHNRAEYEYVHHAPEFLRAGGTDAELDALRAAIGGRGGASTLGPAEQAVLALASEMTTSVDVTPATMERLRGVLPEDRQIVEIVAVVATYNMVSRFLVALGVEPE